MKILVDLDGITADTLPTWLDYIYQDTGIRAVVEDVDDWDLSKCKPFTQVPPEKLWEILNRPGFTANLPVMAGAEAALRQLKDRGHQLYFVTARSGTVSIVETFQWMGKNFPWVDLEKQLCFLHDKYLLKCDVLIDDKPDTLRIYREYHPDARILTITYPYNQEIEGVERVVYGTESWASFVEKIEHGSSA